MGSESSKIKSLQIVKINPGSVSHQNNLLPFMHTIVSYNGNKIKENADIAKLAFEWEEKDLDLLLLDLRTEKEFSITIPKKDNLPLGMSVKYHEGLLRLYCIYVNKVLNTSLLIEKDYIIGIEGVSCDSESNLLNYIELKGREGLILLVFNDKLNYIRRVNFKVEKEKVFEGTEVVKGILYSTKHEKKIKMEEDEEKIKRDIEGIVKGRDGGSRGVDDSKGVDGSKEVPEDKGQDMGDTKGDIKEPTTLTTSLKNNSIVKENQINKEDLKQLEKDLENQEKPRDVDEIAENLENYKEEIEKPREEEKSSLEKELEEIKKKINEEEEKEIREQREREEGVKEGDKEVKEKGKKDLGKEQAEGLDKEPPLEIKDLDKNAPEDLSKIEDQDKDLGKDEGLDKGRDLSKKSLEEKETPLEEKNLSKEKGYEEENALEDTDLHKESFNPLTAEFF